MFEAIVFDFARLFKSTCSPQLLKVDCLEERRQKTHAHALQAYVWNTCSWMKHTGGLCYAVSTIPTRVYPDK
jgi:hypothetical protein